jgi:hypothetical protein
METKFQSSGSMLYAVLSEVEDFNYITSWEEFHKESPLGWIQFEI